MSQELQSLQDAGAVRETLTRPVVTEEMAGNFFEALEDGKTVREASKIIGVSRQTGHRLVNAYKAELESVKHLLATKALRAAEQWALAAEIAATKGDHRPARDLLQTIKAVDPIGSNSGSGITIVIGTPDQPVAIPAHFHRLSPEEETS